MKRLILLLVFLLSSAVLAQAVWVNGYMTREGRWVPGYWRSAPDNTVRNNYDYRGNTNPYTGQQGTRTYPNNPSSGYYRAPAAAPAPPGQLRCPTCQMVTFYQGTQNGVYYYKCQYGHPSETR